MNPTTMSPENPFPQAGSSYGCSSYTAILNDLPHDLSSAHSLCLPKYIPPELPYNCLGLDTAASAPLQECIGSTSHGDSARSILAFLAAQHAYDNNGHIHSLRNDIFPDAPLPLSPSNPAHLILDMDRKVMRTSNSSKWVQGNASSPCVQDLYVSTVDPPKRGFDTDTGFADRKAASFCSYTILPSPDQHAQGYSPGDHSGKAIEASKNCASYGKMQQPMIRSSSNTAQESSGLMLVDNSTIAAMDHHLENPNALLCRGSTCSSPDDNAEACPKEHCSSLNNSDESMGLEAFSCDQNGTFQAASRRAADITDQLLPCKKRSGPRLDRAKNAANIEDLETHDADGNSKRLKNAEGEQEQDAGLKGEESNSGNSGDSTAPEAFKGSTRPPEVPKPDYIHVRARRGQATDSHSLAERVRREKISERMKYLQDLVPNCNKVTGKAVMLDEIINYVQSLQRQVEFLSMKLASVNPRLDCSMVDSLFGRKMFESTRVPLQPLCFTPENLTAYPPLPSSLQVGGSPTGVHPLGSDSEVWTATISRPLDAFASSNSRQISQAWDEDLQNVVQMGLMQGRHELYLNKATCSLGQMKAESYLPCNNEKLTQPQSKCQMYIN